MKILAIEKEVPGIADEQYLPYLEAEARAVWKLYQNGAIREFYFRSDRTEAVLVLESADMEEARTVLASLPLVKNHMIDFELIPLKPYPGFERLFSQKDI